MTAQAMPLLLWPTFISSLLTPDYQHANGSLSDCHDCTTSQPETDSRLLAVEQYFARSLGLSQLAVGLLVVVLSGALPLTSLVDSKSRSLIGCSATPD